MVGHRLGEFSPTRLFRGHTGGKTCAPAAALRNIQRSRRRPQRTHSARGTAICGWSSTVHRQGEEWALRSGVFPELRVLGRCFGAVQWVCARRCRRSVITLANEGQIVPAWKTNTLPVQRTSRVKSWWVANGASTIAFTWASQAACPTGPQCCLPALPRGRHCSSLSRPASGARGGSCFAGVQVVVTHRSSGVVIDRRGAEDRPSCAGLSEGRWYQ